MTSSFLRFAGVSALALAFAACTPTNSTGGAASAQVPDGALFQGDVLGVLGLQSSGDGRLTFATSDVRGDTRVFTDLRLVLPSDAEMMKAAGKGVSIETELDETEIRAERLVIQGAGDTLRGMTFENITVVDHRSSEDEAEQVGLKIASMTIDRPNAAFAQAFGALITEDEEALEELDFAAGDFGFAAINLSGVTLDVPDEDTAFALGSLTLQGLNAGKLEQFVISDLEGEARDDDGVFALSLRSFSASDFDSTLFDGLGDLDDLDDEDEIAGFLANAGFTNPFSKLYKAYEVNDFAASFNGASFAIPRAVGAFNTLANGQVEYTDTSAFSVSFADTAAFGPEFESILDLLGYEVMNFTSSTRTIMDESADRMVVNEGTFALEDGFEFSMTGDFEGIKAYSTAARNFSAQGSGDADPDAIQTMFAPLVLNRFEMSLTDQSIVERALRVAEAQTGMPADMLEVQAGALLSLGAMQLPQGSMRTLALEAARSVQGFIIDGGAITIALDSEGPVRVEDLIAQFSEDPMAADVPLRISHNAAQ